MLGKFVKTLAVSIIDKAMAENDKRLARRLDGR